MANGKTDSSKRRKVWTIICLLLVCIAAVFFRTVLIYKAFPLEYTEMIIKYSEEYSLDKHFVCSVVLTESHFKPEAESNRGAMGLMQIMPDTGKWAADKIDMAHYEESMLSDPETNIRLGCWYLSYLSRLFDGHPDKVLAAYNAGPARVEEWLDANGQLSEIPFEETESYIKKVMRNYEIYKGLYNDL